MRNGGNGSLRVMLPAELLGVAELRFASLISLCYNEQICLGDMLEQYRVLADGCRTINGVNSIGNASKADMFMGAIEQ